MSAPPLPTALRRVRWILALLAVVHIADMALFLAHRGEVRQSIAAASPGLSAVRINDTVNVVIVSGVVPHLVLAAAFAWIWRTLPSGRPRARRAALIVLMADIIAAGFAVSTMKLLPSVVVLTALIVGVSVILQLVALGWLWLSPASRRFFRPVPSGDAAVAGPRP